MYVEEQTMLTILLMYRL